MAGINYHEASDIKEIVEDIIEKLDMKHIPKERLFYIRSKGSSSRNIIARCHALPKIMQQCLEISPAYIIEVLSENFDKMPESEKIKTLIHELLHIPRTFGGGFIHHNVISRKKVDSLFNKFIFSDEKRKI